MARKNDVELVISAKNEASKTISQLVNSLDNLSKEAGGSAAGFFDKLRKSTTEAALSQEQLTAAFSDVEKAQAALRKGSQERERDLRSQNAAIDKTSEKLEELTSEYAELKAAATGARKPAESLVDTFEKQQQKQQGLAASIQKTTQELAEARNELAANSGFDAGAAKAIDQQRQKVKSLGDQWRETTNAVKAAQQELAARQGTQTTNKGAQEEAQKALATLKEQLKVARELAAEKKKEVGATENATKEQIAAQKQAEKAVKDLAKAYQEQVIVERQAREAARQSTTEYNQQSRLVDRLVSKAGKQKEAYVELKDALVEFEAAQSKAGTERQTASIERLEKQLKTLENRYEIAGNQIANSQQKIANASAPDPRAVNRLNALQKKIAETRNTLEQQRGALDRINREYDEAGLSASQLTKEQEQLAQVTERLNRQQKALSETTDKVGDSAKKAAVQAGVADRQFRLWGEGSRQSLSYLQRIRGELLAFGTGLVGIYAAGTAIRSVYDASVVTQRATARLAAKFDSDFGAVNENIQFVREEADRLGIEFEVLLDQYTKFVNNVPDGALSIEQIQFTFQGIAEASRAAGLGTQDVQAVFTALGQIASKNSLALEELRGQLGERIPGAVEAAAKGLSDLSGELITTEELLRRINRGEVGGEAIVAIAKALKDQFGEALPVALESPIASLARFKTVLFEIRQEFAESGFIDALTDGLQQLTTELRTPEFKEGFTTLAQGVAATVRIMTSLIKNLDTVVGFLGAIIAYKLGNYLTGIIGHVNNLTKSFGGFGVSLKKYGSNFEYLSVSAGSLIRGIPVLTGVFYAMKEATEQLLKLFPDTERELRKFFVSVIANFDIWGIYIKEWVDIVKVYFSRGFGNIARDIAKIMTDVLPAVLSFILKNWAKAISVFSDSIAEELNGIADKINSSNDRAVDSIFDSLVGKDVDVSGDIKKIGEEADKAREAVERLLTDTLEGIDFEGKNTEVVPEGQGEVEGERFGEEFIKGLRDIDYFQTGVNAGKSLGEGLLTRLQSIQKSLQDESAETLEQRLAVIEAEFKKFLADLDSFEVSGADQIASIQEDSAKRVAAIRSNANLTEERKRQAITKLEEEAAKRVAKVRAELSSLSGAREQVNQLIELRKEKERQKFFDEQATDAQKKINDAVNERKDAIRQLNELTELGLLTEQERNARLDAINAKTITGIRSAVDEAKRLAAETGNAQLAQTVAGFENFEEIERQRQKLEELERLESRINDELALRETRLSTIATLQETGVIAGADAAERSRQVFEESNAVLEKMVDNAIKLAENLGDQNLIAKLQGVKAGLTQVNDQVFSGAQLSQDFASGFSGAFRSFIQGTQTASEAFRQFVSNFLADIAEAIMQAVILNALTGSYTGGSGGVGAAVAGGLNSFFNHSGGLVGRDGTRKLVNPLAFANAIRYHSGGIAGLKPDEVPTVLQKGEEVLTASDPRHRNNNGSTGQQIGVNIVNTIDAGEAVSEGLASQPGTKTLLNVIRMNRGAIKRMLT